MGGSLTSEMSPNVRISHLLQLKEQGSFAEGVVGVYPSVTYPSHTTIVTGRRPAEHGIYSNLSSREGVTFSSHARGEVVSQMKSPGGNHGYLPFRQGLEASFIAWGPRIKPGVNLHRIRMTAIGPTLLKDLGINDPRFGSEPPLSDIFK